MTQPARTQDSPLASRRSSDPAPRLRGRKLLVARSTWLLLAAGLLFNFIASIPAYYAELLTVCNDPSQCNQYQPTSAILQALHQMGLQLSDFASVFISIDVGVSLVWLIIGALIFWRTSYAWWGLFFSFVLFLFGSTGIASTLSLTFIPRPTQPSIAIFLVYVLGACLTWSLRGAFLLTFPTGRFAPRWTWILVLLWVFQALLFIVAAVTGAPTLLFAAVYLLTWGSVAAVQFYRYRKLYTPVQRQQTKWVVFGYLAGFVFQELYLAVGALVPGLDAPNSPYQLLNGVTSGLTNLLFPLSIGIAILRYQLWDIDTIINKALVYGLLTSILGALYAGLIIGLESLAGLFGGQAASNPIVLVISTLAIAALFFPLRRRIQAVIDRRFYRKKYDAEQTLMAFSASLRQEFDLEQIRARLLAVVQETMQPAHVSLWLRQPERRSTDQAHRLESPAEGSSRLILD